MTPDQITELFTYHTPSGDQPQRYEQINEKAKQLALLVNEICPESAEKTKAIRKIQAARMWANAAIAIHS